MSLTPHLSCPLRTCSDTITLFAPTNEGQTGNGSAGDPFFLPLWIDADLSFCPSFCSPIFSAALLKAWQSIQNFGNNAALGGGAAQQQPQQQQVQQSMQQALANPQMKRAIQGLTSYHIIPGQHTCTQHMECMKANCLLLTGC